MKDSVAKIRCGRKGFDLLLWNENQRSDINL